MYCEGPRSKEESTTPVMVRTKIFHTETTKNELYCLTLKSFTILNVTSSQNPYWFFK